MQGEVMAMDQPEGTDRLSTQSRTHQRAKKPYHKPMARYERVFEASALACSKVESTQGQCHNNPKNS
jgi:hypothetical protein